jgi:hypothetical protein
MPNVELEPGRLYRTRDFAAWSANPPRLAKRLVREGKLVPISGGLFSCPRRSRFGNVPPSDEALMAAFLDGASFVITGPERWNALGLGSTALFAGTLVYNTKRTGHFQIANRPFFLRRVAFPENPPPEWFVVDLLEHTDQAGTSQKDLMPALVRALRRGVFNQERLREMGKRFGTKATQLLIEGALMDSSP